MEIIYVAGGSYKSFYINYFLKLKKCDLIVFNYSVFYNINNKQDFNLVKNEIMQLSSIKNCKIIAVLKIKDKKVFCFCNKTNFTIFNYNKGFIYKQAKEVFSVGVEYSRINAKNKIIFCDNRYVINLNACSKNKFYMFCYNKKLLCVRNKKIKIIFYKYSKIILK